MFIFLQPMELWKLSMNVKLIDLHHSEPMSQENKICSQFPFTPLEHVLVSPCSLSARWSADESH
jgi:hypothetical protein